MGDYTMEDLLGKSVLVGITFLDAAENVVAMIQFSGMIFDAGPDGIKIKSDNLKEVVHQIPDSSAKSNDGVYTLPPDPGAFHEAAKGEYRLRATGGVVVDPDLITQWTVNAPPK